jgi:hypothetical protein
MNGSGVVFTPSVNVNNIERTSGIMFINNNNGIFYGTNVTPTDDFTIPSDRTLTIPSGRTLTIPSNVTLTNNGTVTPANGSTINVLGTIVNNKINGANVNTLSAPASANITATGITLTATSIAAITGQSVEYARSDAGSTAVNSSTWQTSATFSSLTSGATYHFFARSKANDNFSAGAISNSVQAKTPKPITIHPDDIIYTGKTYDGNTSVSGLIITPTAKSGILAGDIVTANFTTAAFDNKDAKR